MQLLIKAGRLVTANENNAVHANQGILVEDGKIKAIDNWDEFSPGDETDVIDAGQLTVMPGLIDAHVHVVHSGDPADDYRVNAFTDSIPTTTLKAAQQAKRHLERGVTTIRDMGSQDWIDVALRDAIAAGRLAGPHMLVACHGITSTGGHMDPRKGVRPELPHSALSGLGAIADGPDEARRAVREQLMRGADVIKINATLSEYVRALGGECSQEMTFEVMQAICEVAHSVSRRVGAHCHGGPGVKAALEAGIDTFEHGRFLTDELLDEIAERGRFLVPTISPEARTKDAGVERGDAALRIWIAKAEAAMYDTVGRAYRRGVKIAAGSDAGMPRVQHGEVAYEVEQLVTAGLSAADALAAATRVAADALGLAKKTGQIKTGLRADLIAVDGDPLQDMTLLQEITNIKLVIKDGRVAIDRRNNHSRA